VLATPKLDGIRCLKINGRALTRSFTWVSNRFTRLIEAHLPDGLDGELIVRGTTFSETAGHFGRDPVSRIAVFYYVSDVDVPYACRMQELSACPSSSTSRKSCLWRSVMRRSLRPTRKLFGRGLRGRDDPHARFATARRSTERRLA
jgi:hypothetical protein